MGAIPIAAIPAKVRQSDTKAPEWAKHRELDRRSKEALGAESPAVLAKPGCGSGRNRGHGCARPAGPRCGKDRSPAVRPGLLCLSPLPARPGQEHERRLAG